MSGGPTSAYVGSLRPSSGTDRPTLGRLTLAHGRRPLSGTDRPTLGGGPTSAYVGSRPPSSGTDRPTLAEKKIALKISGLFLVFICF